MEIKKRDKVRKISTVIETILITILVVFVVAMMIMINNLQGTARVVNYAGLVRGATQRAVKLEITKNPSDELIKYLDDILQDLKYDEDGKYNLVSLNDVDYQKKLDIQIEWEIVFGQSKGYRGWGALGCKPAFGGLGEGVFLLEDPVGQLGLGGVFGGVCLDVA